jgi:predicted transcriptional regulator
MNVLLSIKPKFVERIFAGEKKYEYRKIMFEKGNVENIFVYASTPVKKIVGRIKIDEVLCEAPSMLWNLTADHAGISRAFFFKYFSDRNMAFAIKIKSAEQYHEPLDPYNMVVDFRPPQSFMYLKRGKLLNRLMHLQ